MIKWILENTRRKIKSMMKILLVDDEREEREGIKYLIQKYEYPLEIVEASNGLKALEYIRTYPIDILFTDIKMPKMDGLELSKIVCEYNPKIRIIIFSAYGEFEYAKMALEANAVNYLLKPIELDEFQSVISNTITEIENEWEQEKKAELESYSSRKNLLYRVFTSTESFDNERESVREYLFQNEKSRVCPINVEFMDNFYEEKEEAFLNIVEMYLGKDTEYINLFQSESYLLVRNPKYMKREELEVQLMKMIRDVRQLTQNELSIIVGQPQTEVEGFLAQLKDIHEIRNELLGFADSIIWADRDNVKEHYVLDVEAIKKQLLLAVELNNKTLVEKYSLQLTEAIVRNNVMSRIYVQNMFYSIIYAVYEKNPAMEQEKVIQSVDSLFQMKSANKIIETFPVILKQMLEAAPKHDVDESYITQKIKNLVEKEYMNDISLNYVAESVNLAPTYVSYIFKRETGQTLVKYITDVKMAKAKILLEEGNMKVIGVARACGYDNQPYFNRLFKNYFGITPKQFRER